MSQVFEDNDRRDEDSPRRGISSILPLVIVFLPSFFIGWLFFNLLRRGKQKFTVILSSVIMFEIILFFAWKKLEIFEEVRYLFSNLDKIGDNWQSLIPPLLFFYGFLGGIFGLIMVSLSLKRMRDNPHRRQLPGHWNYKFQYRRSPVEYFIYKRKVKKLKNGEYSNPEKSPLGLDENYLKDEVVYRYNTEAQKHTLISGASGSGKTVTMLSLVKNDIEQQLPVVLIDFKRSPEFASKLAKWAHENEADFYHFVNGEPKNYDVKNSPGQAYYDPLNSGTPTSKADMVLGMREYDSASAVYRANMQQLLQVLFAMLHYADRSKTKNIIWDKGGFYQLASSMMDNNITELSIACEGTPIEKQAEAIEAASKGKTQIRHAMEELQGQIRTITASEYGKWLQSLQGERNIDLFELTKKPGTVILFSLNSDSEPEFASYVGSMILSDLTSVSAKRRNMGVENQVNVYVDEFQAVNPTSVTSLLEKSRESKIAMTLAQQSFEQIVASSENNGEAYLLSILDTCSNFIIHNGSTEDSAIRLSKILGKHWVVKYRMSNKNESFLLSLNWRNKRDSNVTSYEEENWVLEPREFMQLTSPDKTNNYKSTAIIINKTSGDKSFRGKTGAVARRVWMIPNSEVISKFYTPRFSSDYDNNTRSQEYNQSNDDKQVESIIHDARILLGENTFSSINDEELSDDGEFSFEEIDNDSSDDLDGFIENIDLSKSISANVENTVSNNNTSGNKHRISDTSSFDKLFTAQPSTKKTTPPTPTRNSQNKPVTRGIPINPPPIGRNPALSPPAANKGAEGKLTLPDLDDM